jgi:hypothetical protein
MIYRHSQFSSALSSPEYVPLYVRVRVEVSVSGKGPSPLLRKGLE